MFLSHFPICSYILNTDLCDFQYLPCEHKSSGGEVESLIGKILPSAGEDISYVDKDTPSFMLPEMFSKFDKPIPYNYKAGHQLPNSKQQHEMDFRAKLIQHGRHKRTNYAHVVSTMGDFEIPKKPHPIAVEQLEAQKPGATTDEIRQVRRFLSYRSFPSLELTFFPQELFKNKGPLRGFSQELF